MPSPLALTHPGRYDHIAVYPTPVTAAVCIHSEIARRSRPAGYILYRARDKRIQSSGDRHTCGMTAETRGGEPPCRTRRYCKALSRNLVHAGQRRRATWAEWMSC